MCPSHSEFLADVPFLPPDADLTRGFECAPPPPPHTPWAIMVYHRQQWRRHCGSNQEGGMYPLHVHDSLLLVDGMPPPPPHPSTYKKFCLDTNTF